jgi:hypothetical protein
MNHGLKHAIFANAGNEKHDLGNSFEINWANMKTPLPTVEGIGPSCLTLRSGHWKSILEF